MSVYMVRSDGEYHYVEAPGFEQALQAFRMWVLDENEEMELGEVPLESVEEVSEADVIRYDPSRFGARKAGGKP